MTRPQASSSTAPGRIGRFELRRVLGRGAQAAVWLAHDPVLQREVAVKLPGQDIDAGAVDLWLHEARAVSRLAHPHIVPVFEADRAGSQPYLVFEYVAGPTLADAMRQRGSFAPHDAVALMLGVLDALAAAHEQGIVHRDLKPSNVLLGSDGRARVMDFGIAARSGSGDGSIVGTPGYISPEAARGDAPQPAMDVFAAGVVLAELLSGQKLLRETDPMRALARVQHEDLLLPAQQGVDDALRGIVQRALARDPPERHAGAQAMRAALLAWQQPAADASAGHGTLAFLLRRMRTKGDFPVLSDAVLRIQKVATSETDGVAELAAEILKDVALTNKLLRMVNSAHFGAAGGEVSTVSRAVALVGFAGIRNMALSLLLLEHMRDKGHAQALKDEFVRALMAGQLADALTPDTRDAEEAFLGSMFQNLGRLLAAYYFPDEAQAIAQAGDSPAAREQAAVRVLGIGSVELGVGIAKSWGLPETLQRVMQPPPGDAPAKAVGRGVERQRWTGRVGNEMADALLLPDAEAGQRRIEDVATRYAAALGLQPRAIAGAVDAARQRLSLMTPAMGLHAAPGSAARRLLHGAADDAATLLLAPIATPVPAGADALTAGIQRITDRLAADDVRLDDVLRLVLQTMQRALGLQRVVFCLRDAKDAALTGRIAEGAGADALRRVFRVPVGSAACDLFGAVCTKGVDTLIADAGAANIASRLPAWYRQRDIAAPSFLLLPLQRKGAAFGLIYADKAAAGWTIAEKELALLRTLRNQAGMAFRQTDR